MTKLKEFLSGNKSEKEMNRVEKWVISTKRVVFDLAGIGPLNTFDTPERRISLSYSDQNLFNVLNTSAQIFNVSGLVATVRTNPEILPIAIGGALGVNAFVGGLRELTDHLRRKEAKVEPMELRQGVLSK